MSQLERGICVDCGIKPQVSKGRDKKGRKIFRKECTVCAKRKYGKRSYTKHKRDSCELCGFVAIHPCQLDVDHIDGNHNNNEKSNLQTLCANCHRLKTQLNGDHLNK